MSHDDQVKALATAVAAQIKAGRGTAYTQKTIKPGDTIQASAGITEQTFASQYVIPANSLAVGDTITVIGSGVFTSTAVTAPTQRPRIRLGGLVVVDPGAQMLLLGATNNLYRFVNQITVRAIGTSGSVESTAELRFSGSAGVIQNVSAGPTGAGVGATPVTVNTTTALSLALSTQYSAATAGNSNTLRQMTVTISKAGSAST